MKNGWTGGQYSVFRIPLGLYVGALFLATMAWGGHVRLTERADSLSVFALSSSSGFGLAVLLLGGVFAVLLAVGFFDRVAAAACAYLLLCERSAEFHADAFSLFLIVPLAAHCLAPAAPYGSWRARGRPDPDGGWRFPSAVFWGERALILALFLWVGVWAVNSGGSVAAWGAFFLLLLVLLIFTRYRLVAWLFLLASLAVQSWVFARFSGAWFLLAFKLFNPDWVRPKIGSGKATMFYDGECALCHGGVRFILAEDRFDSIRFVPLQSEIFKERVTATERLRLGDSVVFETESGELVSRSTASVFMLERLGGLWRIAGVLLFLIPRPLRNIAYDLVAATRYQIFGKKKDHCPIISPELRGRFDL